MTWRPCSLWTLRCPDCSSQLVVDRATGEILSHRPAQIPPAEGKDLTALVEELDQQKEEAEEIFSREMEALEDRDRLLEEKFREALKNAEDDPDEGPPVRPFDLD